MFTARIRNRYIEVGVTADERTMIERAATAEGVDPEAFVLGHATLAAGRVLADRTESVVDEEQQRAWDAISNRSAQDLPGLRRLVKDARRSLR
ncbi:MAG: DUF1778 domain-containing protein [Patulibacter sp.]|nr:DUF1778 domain-containing protein [Patulibacter sp.]